jgi:hypothetical protein
MDRGSVFRIGTVKVTVNVEDPATFLDFESQVTALADQVFGSDNWQGGSRFASVYSSEGAMSFAADELFGDLDGETTAE